MKIAIISDSHDNVYNIEKFLDFAEKNKIEMIIHCGDLAAPSMLKNEFGPKFKGLFHFIHGNVADRELNEKVAKEFSQMTCHGDEGELNIDGQRIGFCHYPDQAKMMAASGDYNIVFYGHDHKPWMKTLENGCQLINPGTLAGLFNKATFSVYNTDSKEIELVLVEQI
ncbi:MAG: YfcE family phosphodiesterase [Desulfobacula sp.]|jgi:hypothetical protein